MTKNFKPLYVIIATISILVFVEYKDWKVDKAITIRNCKTVKMPIQGVILGSAGKNSYTVILVNNIKDEVGMNTSKEILKKGFDQYMFEKGDSIIKNANSNTVMFKRGDSVIVYTIGCDD
ncbi:hypothetical protein [Ferruginibacter albus]|uniref:hypothetical protein n=1 Tax=Ferruginibacter albus TaxID=2875540 RepID=UPI001CC3409D|nr:hypothetical protein [Ferruginibacter albus]UAY52880.1 hypothetical protein K9M53_04175 [Ferruginibacter albus]